ncbi:MAG: hypothetical protein Ct9H300mP16_02900 [Pseudomonadota bacterium]|nr:MAG: hypothetical protein Ct9H300mP16_02900 [Pseudomonadota bacterium]
MTSKGMPVCACRWDTDRKRENLHSVYEFEELIKRGGVTYPEPDAATWAGSHRGSRWPAWPNLRSSGDLSRCSRHSCPPAGCGSNAPYLEVHGFGLERFIAEPLSEEAWPCAERMVTA